MKRHPAIIETDQTPIHPAIIGSCAKPADDPVSRFLTEFDAAPPSARRRGRPPEEIVILADRIPPPEPTDAEPGSDEKIEALAKRWAAGMGLWHAEDKTNKTDLSKLLTIT